MAHTRKVIAPDIGRQRNVAVGAGADQVRRRAQVVELRRSERLHDFWTGLRRGATIEQSRRGTTSGFVRVIRPPDDTVTPGFVHRGPATRRPESDVHRQEADGDIRVAAVEDNSSGFVLVEAQVNEAAKEVSRLRSALADRRRDLPAQNIGGAGVILFAVAQIRVQIARRREPDAVDLRVLRVYTTSYK